MFPWFRSKRESTQSKRSKQTGKQNHPRSTRGRPKEGSKFTQTTQKERDHMFELRSQGFSVHAIAKELSRSSRTVHQVLTERGTMPLPEPEDQLPNYGRESKEKNSRNRRRKRRRRGGSSTKEGSVSSSPLWKSVDPMLEQMAKDLINTNEDFAIQVLAAKLGIKVPAISVEDSIQKEIRRSPELLDRLTEDKVNRMLRRGRTEAEIAEEFFGLAIKLAEWKETGRWADIAEKAVTSGELRKTVEAIAGAMSKNRQPPSEETPHPHTSKQDDNAPKVQNQEIESTGLEAGTPVASASQESNSTLNDNALRPKGSEGQNGNQLKRKRRDSSELSPEERERRLEIIRRPIPITLDQANACIPAATFVPEKPDGHAFEELGGGFLIWSLSGLSRIA